MRSNPNSITHSHGHELVTEKAPYSQFRRQRVERLSDLKEVRMASEGDFSVNTRGHDKPPDGAGRPDAG
ncbi:hypothetical protein M2302_003817 [Micromonospora sp. A200]|nr:hypothetical protein [Micromonospora sp. A200]